MIRTKLFIALTILAGASLSACGKNSGSDASATDNFGSSSARPEDRFGEGFGEAYRADPYSEPANVSDNDVTPVSTTAEPLPVD